MQRELSRDDILAMTDDELKALLRRTRTHIAPSYQHYDLLALALGLYGYDVPEEEEVGTKQEACSVAKQADNIVDALFPVQLANVMALFSILVTKGHRAGLEMSETGVGKSYMALALAVVMGYWCFFITKASVIPQIYELIVQFNLQDTVLGFSSYSLAIEGKYHTPASYNEDNPIGIPCPYIKTITTTSGKREINWLNLHTTLMVFDEIHSAKNDRTYAFQLLSQCYNYVRFDLEANNKMLLVGATPYDKQEDAVYLMYVLSLIPDLSIRSANAYLAKIMYGGTFTQKLAYRLFDKRDPLATKITKEEIQPSQYKTSINIRTYDLGKRASKTIQRANIEIQKLLKDRSVNLLTGLLRQRQIIELNKCHKLAELATKSLARHHSCIIFVEFHASSALLFELLKEYQPRFIIGKSQDSVETFRGYEQYVGDNAKKRRIIAHGFQYREYNLLIVHHGAGGVGLSLHALVPGQDTDVFMDATLNGIVMFQALGRADRLCKQSNVRQYIVFAASTEDVDASIDAKIARILAVKLQNIQQLSKDVLAKAYLDAEQTGEAEEEQGPINITIRPTSLIELEEE